MGIHINLLHEQEALRTARERDPLKLAIFGLIAVALGLAAFYFYRNSQLSELRGQVAELSAQWATKEPKVAEATSRQVELAALLETFESAVAKIENRFFWGPVMEILLRSTPEEVQVMNLTGSFDPERSEFQMTLVGISAGPEPRPVADAFRSAVSENLEKNAEFSEVEARFASLDEQTTQVSLRGKRLPTAKFIIQVKCKFQPLDPTTNATAPAAP